MSTDKPTFNLYSPYMGITRALIAKRCRTGGTITVALLETVWPAIVGAELAKRTRPVKLTPDKIVVAVPSELWRREMGGANRQRLLDRINHLIPEPLQALNLVIGEPDLFPRSARRPPRAAPEMGEMPANEAEILEEMEDEDLADLLVRIRRLNTGKG